MWATVPRMAGKGWTTEVAAAAGIAAGTGAAQLGLGYGLGVVVWPVAPVADDSGWLGSLGWATWIAASSTVFGAVIAERLRGDPAGRAGGPLRFPLAAAAAVGALLTVVLIAVPARSAVRADTFAPETIAGGYAVIGILFGLIVAYWAVVSRPVAANLVATASYLWALAATAIVVDLSLGRDSATYLTSWQFADLGEATRYGTIYWPSAVLTLLAAAILGMIAAWPAVRQGNLGIGAAASGAVGPLLVAAAFFVLAPQLTGALGQLESAYLIAPYAVLAGLAGSALMVAVGRQMADRRQALRHRRPARPTATAQPPTRPGLKDRLTQTPWGARARATGRAGPVTLSARRSPTKSAEPVITTSPGNEAPATAQPAAATAEPAQRFPAKADAPGRSTVAAPPASPPVAKINPGRDAKR